MSNHLTILHFSRELSQEPVFCPRTSLNSKKQILTTPLKQQKTDPNNTIKTAKNRS
jgi:hypothetical protein